MLNKTTRAIASWSPHEDPLRWSDDRFDDLAVELFAHQLEHNDHFRRLCEQRGVDTPADIDDYRDIPAVATDVFKRVALDCGGSAERVFRTSGTTLGQRGEHRFASLDAYRASLHPPFERFCLPDRQIDDYRMLVVAPAPGDLPDSSLSYMLGELVDRWGDDESAFFASADASGELAFDFAALERALDAAADAADVPVFVLGTAFGLAEFFETSDESWQLGDDARVMETGGFKGKTRRLTKSDLYDMIEARLGVASTDVVSEYSMTELSSQAYTANLVDRRWADVAPDERPFYPPPWARIEVVDPATLEVLREPGRGLIRWYDLANVGSVLAVQTSDMGRTTDDGGLVLGGRAPDADLRGCSLTAEEIADR